MNIISNRSKPVYSTWMMLAEMRESLAERSQATKDSPVKKSPTPGNAEELVVISPERR